MIDKNDSRLTDFVLGELNPAESAEIQNAIANSEELQNAVEEIRQTAMLLDAAYQTEEPLRLLDEQKAEITQLQIEEAARELKPVTVGRPWLPIVLAASLLGLLVGGAIYLQDPAVNPEVAERFEKIGKLDDERLKDLKERADESIELNKLAMESVETPESDKSASFRYKPADGASLSEAEKTEQLGKLVGDFNKLVDESRFAEAQVLAQRAGELAPDSDIAEILNEKGKLLRRIERMESTAHPKEEGFWSAMENVRESSIAVDESISPDENSFERSGASDPQKFKIEPFSGLAARSLDAPARPNQNAGAEIRGGIIMNLEHNRGRQADSNAFDDFGDDEEDEERAVGQETPQMMKMMQQLAGGGRRAGQQDGGGFGGAKRSDNGINDQFGGGFGCAGGGETGGGMGMGAGERGIGGGERPEPMAGEAFQSNGLVESELKAQFGRPVVSGIAGKQDPDGSSEESFDADNRLAGNSKSPASEKTDWILSEENRIRTDGRRRSKSLANSTPAPSEAPKGINDHLAQDKPGLGIELGDAENKNMTDGQKAAELDAEGEGSGHMALSRSKESIVPLPSKQPAELGKAPATERAEGKTVESEDTDEFSLPGEAKAYSEQLFSKRDSANKGASELPNEKQLLGELADLDEVEQLGIRFKRQLQRQQKTRTVPVQRTRPEVRTRKVELADGTTKTENYTVEVPFTENVTQNYFVEVPQVVVDFEPKATNRFVDNLTKRIDPSGTREIGVKELFDKTRELIESEADQSGAKDKDLLLAFGLREQIAKADEKKSEFDVTPALKKVNEVLMKRNAKIRQAKTWKRVKAIPNTTRLMLGDRTELDLTGMQVNVLVDGFRARVLLDYFYYNDRNEQLRGNFKLRLPDDASLYYFAFGESAYDLSPKGEIASEEFHDDGTQFVSLSAERIRVSRQDAWKNVKESRMVPREKAAHAFGETVRRKVDPALAEWSSAGVFNAQVFPLAPKKLHRIVIGYDVNLTKVGGKWAYELDLPQQTGQCQVDINVQKVAGVEYAIEPKSDPFENEIDGKTQRRYRFEGPQKQTIRLTASKSPEMLLYSAENFWGTQVTPELPVEKVASNPRAIFLVDTSLSSNPDKFNVWLKLLESTLENNRDSLKQFNVMFFNVDAHFWQEKWIDNTPGNTEQLLEKCNTLALEGATDLYGAIEKISKSDWVFDSGKDAGGKPLVGPDLFLLSDGAATWGETNLRLISRKLQDQQLGSLFAYQTGLTGTAISGLRFLAGQSGGAVFSVANEDEIKLASTAHRKRPWKLVSISAAGTSDIMTAGRIQWVYPGQAITIVGRGKVDGELKLELEQTGRTKTTSISPAPIKSELASRLYGQVAVGQLESLGAKVFDVAASYARHFRVTGETCSLLMLETEADYQRFDIKPHEDLFVIKSKEAKELVTSVLKQSASELADPKAQLLAWLARLETMPGMSFKMPTALKLAMDDIQVVAISKPLDCRLSSRDGLSKEYLVAIQNERLDYEVIAAEANRRARTSVDDAIKVFSSLVERNPGDLVIARDVAFTALELGRPAQAYHLLRSVAKARPFEGSIYPALGQCLTQLGQSDMAIVYYEIALNGSFNRMGKDFQKIVSAEYMYLLRQIVDGKMDSSVKSFAAARLETLKKNLHFDSAELLITMMWNTDQTDVDLHIVEPSSEECSYENTKTRSGGQITSDITTGYGPEMYSNPEAPGGKYEIKVKYFTSDQNRTELRNKVHLTIYRGFGTRRERVTRKTVQLNTVGQKESVATVGVD